MTSQLKSHCLLCLLFPEYNIVQYLLPIQPFCRHRKYHFSTTPHVKIIPVNLVFFVFTSLVFLAAIISYLIQIPFLCNNEKSSCLMLINDCYVVTGTTLLSFLLAGKIVPKQQELSALLYLFENPQVFNLKTIIDKKDSKKFGTLTIIFLVVWGFSPTHFFYSYDNFEWAFLRKSAFFIVFVYNTTNVLELIRHVLVLGVVLQAFKTRLVSLNNQREVLKKCQHLVAFVHGTVNLKMKSLTILLSMYLVGVTSSLIFNISILIKYEDYNVQCQLRSVLTIAAIITFLVICETEVNNKTDDILSFLFKYPISKMTLLEATQMEVLISTLIIQKPVLRASDIFTVGTRLLASISGTVVTYVLVALQFRASWAE